MAKVIIQVIYGFFHMIASSLLSPSFALLDSWLLNIGFTQYINLFNSILSTYVAPFVGFIFQFMGPKTIDIIALEFVATIGFHSITLATTGILKIFKVIKKFPLA